MKFKIVPPPAPLVPEEPVTELSLHKYPDGSVIVRATTGGMQSNLIRFATSGQVTTISSVSEDHGFRLNLDARDLKII